MKEEYENSTEVVSEEEFISSDVADFETPPSHQDKEHHSAVNNNTDSISSNGEKVEGSRYNLNVYSAAEGKEPENVSSNLDDVSATTTTDNDTDNAEFQSSTITVPTTTTTVISKELYQTKTTFLLLLLLMMMMLIRTHTANARIRLKI